MGSLTALLYLSQNALDANQAALDITSNNVANANTPGYTDEIATWRELDTVSLSGNAASGMGAAVSATSQRDPVLNQRVQQQTQAVAASTAETSALADLQSIFGLSSNASSSASTVLGTDINAFFNSFSSLQASPSNMSVRQGVISAAATLATDFNSAASGIAQQTAALNQQATGIVSSVNSLLTSIAQLNVQIQSSSLNAGAGTLEDQRQQDLTQLSTLIGFDQIKTENNGLTLTTANGQPLVSEGQAFALSTSLANGNVHIVTASGQDITSTLAGGQLGGIVAARDRDLPNATAALNALSQGVASAVNTQNEAGLDANGNPGGAIFTIAGSTITLANTDPRAIAAAGANEGPTGSSNASALAALANGNFVNGQTASGFFASFLTQLGSQVAQAQQQNTTQRASLTQLTTQQSAQSSVSLDQEAANLSLYERSYDAAAKVFTIIDQLMAVALNLGEQSTVS
jgi:flagellar hook-associated protein 1